MQEKPEWDFPNYRNIQVLEEFSRGEAGTCLTRYSRIDYLVY